MIRAYTIVGILSNPPAIPRAAVVPRASRTEKLDRLVRPEGTAPELFVQTSGPGYPPSPLPEIDATPEENSGPGVCLSGRVDRRSKSRSGAPPAKDSRATPVEKTTRAR